ncbi:MAG: hypothetical protein K6C68_02865 [Ruminococcus sp.]|nr:hypothetical protein [Ruminococcus sp.]
MEILEILKNNSSDLIPEDIALFKTELAVGTYTEDYKKQCYELIDRYESWNKADEKDKCTKKTSDIPGMNISDIAPKGSAPKLSFSDQFKADLNVMRLSNTYKSSFRAYIKSHNEFDETFIDHNFSLFDAHELEAIVSELPLSEAFLDKYFSALDNDKIARYQLFSESFFKKHFVEFDAETVLTKGRNEWRKKENRSKQLDVFLRLKGVNY